MTKFPKYALNKWNRFTSIEKLLIFYYVLLIGLFIVTPIFEISKIDSSQWSIQYTIFNPYMVKTYIVLSLSFLFLILWNTSFRFKKLINVLVWFKENDALLSFLVLWFISFAVLTIQDTANLMYHSLSTLVKVSTGYYIIFAMLILWLTANLFLALWFSKNKRKTQIVNISQHSEKEEQEKDSVIKWLFQ